MVGPRSQYKGVSPWPSLGSSRPLGLSPLPEAIRSLGLPAAEERLPPGPESGAGDVNPFAAILPLLASLPGVSGGGEQAKPARYLVAKGLPTLPRKQVEKVWRLEYVDMEEFLPAPRSLRLAEQGKPSSLQFLALQQHRFQRRVTDIMTWVRCFTLFMAVLSQRSPGMVPDMMAHLHTVLRLQQKATSQLAWLEYDIQFRMELASSTDLPAVVRMATNVYSPTAATTVAR